MPVEDVSIHWSEKTSPFVRVARVVIEKQTVDPQVQNTFCENISMTPWHALPEHEPIGGLNRIRKSVYQGIARYRRCNNHVAFGEPAEDGSPVLPFHVCTPDAPVPVVNVSNPVQQ